MKTKSNEKKPMLLNLFRSHGNNEKKKQTTTMVERIFVDISITSYEKN